MAKRRMFSKTITNSSQFLMMPQSAQNLYFHLGMNADDDGFCEHFTIMRMTDSKPDDLRILQAKGFVKIFDDKVLIIIDWKENNYIKKDRYTPSKYLKIYKEELKKLSSGIQNGYKMDTQVRLGKVRLGKKPLSAKADEENFSFDGFLQEMKTNKQRHIQIIRLYWLAKKRRYENRKQADSAIRRDLKAASALVGYSDEQIQNTMKWLDKNFQGGVKRWTLETVGKYIDDYKNIKERKILQ